MAKRLRPEPESARWDSDWLPEKGGFDVADWVKRGATLDDILAAIEEPERDECAELIEKQKPKQLLRRLFEAERDQDTDLADGIRAQLYTAWKIPGDAINSRLLEILREEYGDPISSADSNPDIDLDLVEGTDYLLPGVIPANAVSMLWGKSGDGKSTGCLHIARAVVLGENFLDWVEPCQTPGEVLFIATDSGPNPIADHLKEVGWTREQEPEFYKGLKVWAEGQGKRAWKATIPDMIRLLERVKEGNTRLVIIDSAKAVTGRGGFSYTDNQAVGVWLNFLNEVVCRYCAVLLIHHDGTEKGTAAGAKAWRENVDFVIQLERVNPEQVTYRITKDRKGGNLREVLTTIKDGFVTLCDPKSKISNAKDAIIDCCQRAWANGHREFSRSHIIQELATSHGYSAKTVHNNLRALLKASRQNCILVAAAKGKVRFSPSREKMLASESAQALAEEPGEKSLTHTLIHTHPPSSFLPFGNEVPKPGSSSGFPAKDDPKNPSGTGTKRESSEGGTEIPDNSRPGIGNGNGQKTTETLSQSGESASDSLGKGKGERGVSSDDLLAPSTRTDEDHLLAETLSQSGESASDSRWVRHSFPKAYQLHLRGRRGWIAGELNGKPLTSVNWEDGTVEEVPTAELEPAPAPQGGAA
jgi:hypothetical protein